VQALVPRPDLAPRLQERFVALAADVDGDEPEIDALLEELGGASMLPIVLFATPAGRLLSGRAGSQTPEGLNQLLDKALAAHGGSS